MMLPRSAGEVLDLRRLRLHGLLERIAGTHRYRVTSYGLATALLLTRTYTRVVLSGARRPPPTLVRWTLP
ncbi:MAG TPA: hypothetical protein VG276_26585 [Actinomycetes bacterium]|jgi:hypothetical protein|nr:hypothetical protein [Actinomycetes bacterium]